MANRHRQAARNTSTERQCPVCKGAGELTRNTSWNRDPQCDYQVACTNPVCVDGWVRWAAIDPLEVMAALRHRRFSFPAGIRYGELQAAALCESLLPDAQVQDWRAAA
jgi:hypothetical protein